MSGEPWSSLTASEMNALLAAPDRTTWVGRRDHAILSVALQTGLRVSEIINLRRRDIVTGTGAHIRCEGKGRKQRCTPLRQETHRRSWTSGSRNELAADDDPLFPTMRGYQTQPRCARTPGAEAYAVSIKIVPVADRKTGESARAPAQHGDGAAAPWRRSIGDRALARA